MKGQTQQTVFYDPYRHGVTQGLLNRFLTCRQLARLWLLGWSERKSNVGQHFGNLSHEVLRRVYHAATQGKLPAPPGPKYVAKRVEEYVAQWRGENERAGADETQHVETAALMAAVVLPPYFKKWNKDFTTRKWLALEDEFTVMRRVTPLSHPQGVYIKVRGKRDATFREDKKLWLFETKTKGRLGESGESILADTMPYERQVNLYLSALRGQLNETPRGLLYNIIRRPQLRQRVNETTEQFVNRIGADVAERPDFYFLRMEMEVDDQDINRAESELDDLITDFLNWWEGKAGHYRNDQACETKYGRCGMLGICGRNDFAQVYKRDSVFPELEE